MVPTIRLNGPITPSPQKGYSLLRVYDGRSLLGSRPSVYRCRHQIVFLASWDSSRTIIEMMEPAISPNAIARLSTRDDALAHAEWGAMRFHAFPRQLAATRLFVENYLMERALRLDARPEREAERLPFVETGGPWRRLPTTYYWQNAAALHLEAGVLNGARLEDQVEALLNQPHIMLQPRFRRLTQEEVAVYFSRAGPPGSSRLN
jgi:hypothetical protein